MLYSPYPDSDTKLIYVSYNGIVYGYVYGWMCVCVPVCVRIPSQALCTLRIHNKRRHLNDVISIMTWEVLRLTCLLRSSYLLQLFPAQFYRKTAIS